ncbi:MAG: ABC transporter ATP-binding protein [Halobacteriovoraceae bacterium]|jgi:ABC-2 type transport system ATP-binding protein|nr:ABC transporter ATP-binding protein [Halobacteriovoraceae bacterium]MBT5092909.1 ABC transporter ATP-binding protein [Halobacteriovoraceae bacterium]
MANVLEVSGLHKFYGKKHALRGVDFSIKEGTFHGLLGPNGAGKSTLTKCLLGLLSIGSGSISIKGEDYRNPSVRKDIFYLPERFSFYPFYNVEDILEFYGKAHGLSKMQCLMRLNEVLDILNLDEIRDQKSETLSKGQLQRTGLACTLMSNASIYLLDEPFSGLDPIVIKDIKDILHKEKEKGKTILINSHILSEIEKICETVTVIDKGKTIKTMDIKDIKEGEDLEKVFYDLIKGGNN